MTSPLRSNPNLTFINTTIMEWITPEMFMWSVSQVAICAAVWGAVRADIKAIHRELSLQDKRLDRLDGRVLEAYAQLHVRVAEAHQRIDAFTGTERARHHNI